MYPFAQSCKRVWLAAPSPGHRCRVTVPFSVCAWQDVPCGGRVWGGGAQGGGEGCSRGRGLWGGQAHLLFRKAPSSSRPAPAPTRLSRCAHLFLVTSVGFAPPRRHGGHAPALTALTCAQVSDRGELRHAGGARRAGRVVAAHRRVPRHAGAALPGQHRPVPVAALLHGQQPGQRGLPHPLRE